MANGSNVAIAEFQPVPALDGIWTVGKPRAKEGRKEKVPRTIPGELAPRAIGAMRPRSKAEDEQTGIGQTKTGNGLAPVRIITVRGALFKRDLLAPSHQTRAFATGDQASGKLIKAHVGLHGQSIPADCVDRIWTWQLGGLQPKATGWNLRSRARGC